MHVCAKRNHEVGYLAVNSVFARLPQRDRQRRRRRAAPPSREVRREHVPEGLDGVASGDYAGDEVLDYQQASRYAERSKHYHNATLAYRGELAARGQVGYYGEYVERQQRHERPVYSKCDDFAHLGKYTL